MTVEKYAMSSQKTKAPGNGQGFSLQFFFLVIYLSVFLLTNSGSMHYVSMSLNLKLCLFTKRMLKMIIKNIVECTSHT